MKKPSSIRIKIDSPCKKRWDEMLPKTNGRHCDSCNKTVIDFRNKSDKFIYETFQNKGENICGRYYKHQLNRNIFGGSKVNSNIYPRMLLSISFLTSIISTTEANKNLTAFENTIPSEGKIENKNYGPIFEKPQLVKFIEGKVLFMDYEDHPNPDVIVKIEKSSIKTITDSNGYFKLIIPDRFCSKDSLVIEFGPKGSIFQEVKISTKDLPKTVNLYIQQEAAEEEFMGFNTETYIVGQYEGKVKKQKEERKKKSLFRLNNK